MSKIKLHITKESFNALNLDALIALQDIQMGETPDLRGLRSFITAFMVDENLVPVPGGVARRMLGMLNAEELTQVSQDLIRKVQELAVPKQTGGSSSMPSSITETAPSG